MNRHEVLNAVGVKFRRAWGLLLILVVAFTGCGKKARLDPDLVRLVEEKRSQAHELAAAQTNPVPIKVWKFFDAVHRDDWYSATNFFNELKDLRPNYRSYEPELRERFWIKVRSWFELAFGALRPRAPSALDTALWGPIVETRGAGEVFHDWDSGLLHRFGNDIIKSIPTNSIYFGGSDPGRFIVATLSQSHWRAKPFFTLTQNALADHSYLEYLDQMYGDRIHIPTASEFQQAFQDYMNDAQKRAQASQLKPGEDTRTWGTRDENGLVMTPGVVAVMDINGRLVNVILDKNPSHEVYIEESYVMGWMSPHLTPHGLIFKLNRKPLEELSEAIVREDHEYWLQYGGQLVGPWLTDKTSVKEICDFARRVYSQKDLSSFTGDPAFARNEAARKAFSKLRSAIAGVYAWRAEHAANADDKAQMLKEANFAFRQALALCPNSTEAVYRYANFLLANNRSEDAMLVAETARALEPASDQWKELIGRLKQSR
jgi:hypothetical protein